VTIPRVPLRAPFDPRRTDRIIATATVGAIGFVLTEHALLVRWIDFRVEQIRSAA